MKRDRGQAVIQPVYRRFILSGRQTQYHCQRDHIRQTMKKEADRDVSALNIASLCVERHGRRPLMLEHVNQAGGFRSKGAVEQVNA